MDFDGEKEHLPDLLQGDDPLLNQPCVRFGLPDEAAYACEVVDRLRAVADEIGDAFVPSLGLGLSAPQIGIARMAAIVRPRGGSETVLLNPRIIEATADETSQYESCLSLVGVHGLVPRPNTVDVAHQQLDGSLVTSRFRNGKARLAAHEVDHLNGVLYTARMLPGADLVPLNDVPHTAGGEAEQHVAAAREDPPCLTSRGAGGGPSLPRVSLARRAARRAGPWLCRRRRG